MVDGDVYVTDGCIERLREACVEWDATLVCPRVLLFPEKHIVQCDGAAPHFIGTHDPPPCLFACRTVDV